MLISCNRLKKYIKNAHDIDFKTIWDDFTLRVAEVEGITIKGEDIKDVVTAQIISCEKHPESTKLSLLKVTDGKNEYNIVCGAPNVLRESGIDPEEYTGFAFGFGITRIAMMKYKIGDIRVLNSGDVRALKEFEIE